MDNELLFGFVLIYAVAVGIGVIIYLWNKKGMGKT